MRSDYLVFKRKLAYFTRLNKTVETVDWLIRSEPGLRLKMDTKYFRTVDVHSQHFRLKLARHLGLIDSSLWLNSFRGVGR